MREETMDLVRATVAECDNACQAFGDTFEEYFGTTDIDKVGEILYQSALELSEVDSNYSKAIRFDGKKAIVKALKEEVMKSEYCYLNKEV